MEDPITIQSYKKKTKQLIDNLELEDDIVPPWVENYNEKL